MKYKNYEKLIRIRSQVKTDGTVNLKELITIIMDTLIDIGERELDDPKPKTKKKK